MHVRLLALVSLAMLGANVASATTYFDTINVPSSYSGNADGPSDGAMLMAVSFNVPGTPDFRSITLALNADTPSDSGSFMVYLLPDDGSGAPGLAGFPSLTLDSSETFATGFGFSSLLGTIADSDLAMLGDAPTLVTLSISNAALSAVTSATSNGEYWIGLVPDGASSVEWSLSTDGTGVGTDGQSNYMNDGSSFGSTFDLSGGAYQMLVSTESVPEPATIALLGGGLAGMGYVRRRKARNA